MKGYYDSKQLISNPNKKICVGIHFQKNINIFEMLPSSNQLQRKNFMEVKSEDFEGQSVES